VRPVGFELTVGHACPESIRRSPFCAMVSFEFIVSAIPRAKRNQHDAMLASHARGVIGSKRYPDRMISGSETRGKLGL
jgi:hypothetical protein